MPHLWIGLLLAAVVTTPTPEPALKTIITVHSSDFCSALILAVRPALAGLMHNDQLIDLGRSALVAGDRDVKFGGTVTSSFNQRGAATWSANEGDVQLLNNRQRQLAAAMTYNIDAVEAALANPNAPAPSGDDKAKLASIEAQLEAIARQQRTAINVISGNADTSDLASLYNEEEYSAIDDVRKGSSAVTSADLNGVSPTDSRLTSQHNYVSGAGATTDPTAASQTRISQAQTSAPFYSPYENLIRALDLRQTEIDRSEAIASKAIVDAAIECQ